MFFLQELTDKMKAFVEKYEKKADGKIGIIEVRSVHVLLMLKHCIMGLKHREHTGDLKSLV